MGKLTDLTGQRFGRLTVLKITNERTKNGTVMWECQCDCGEICHASTISLMSNDPKRQKRSCGCYQREQYFQCGLTNLKNKCCKENTMINHLNEKKSKNNTSGVKGVTWESSKNKWRAQIGFKGRNIILGRFSDIEDAIKSRREAEEKYFVPLLETYGGSRWTPTPD